MAGPAAWVEWLFGLRDLGLDPALALVAPVGELLDPAEPPPPVSPWLRPAAARVAARGDLACPTSPVPLAVRLALLHVLLARAPFPDSLRLPGGVTRRAAAEALTAALRANPGRRPGTGPSRGLEAATAAVVAAAAAAPPGLGAELLQLHRATRAGAAELLRLHALRVAGGAEAARALDLLALPPGPAPISVVSPQEAPSGGFTGLSHRGGLVDLLPSQLALPRTELIRRLAAGEALHRSRERRPPPRLRATLLVLDASPPMWGDPEAVARAAGLAAGRALLKAGHPVAVALAADGLRTWPRAATEEDLAPLVESRTEEAPDRARVLEDAARAVAVLGPGVGRVILLAHDGWWIPSDAVARAAASLRERASLRALLVRLPGGRTPRDPGWFEGSVLLARPSTGALGRGISSVLYD